MGLVTSPHTRTPEPKDNNQRALAAHPKGRSVGGARVPDLKHPAWRQEVAPPPRRSLAASRACRANLQECAPCGWWQVPTPTAPAPKDRGPRAPAVSAKNGW